MNLQKHFEKVQDFRVQGRCYHSLVDILVIILCGTIADCSDFIEIYDYAKDKKVFFLKVWDSLYLMVSLLLILSGVLCVT